MHQTRLCPPFFQDGLHPLFFAQRFLFTDELNLYLVRFGQPLGIRPNGVAERFGKLGVVEYPYTLLVQEFGHALGITEGMKIATEQQAVITM